MFFSRNIFQDYSSNNILLIISLHDLIIYIILLICVFVFVIIFYVYKEVYCTLYSINHFIEYIWTIIPIIILFYISFPSLSSIYNIEERRGITYKILGHQWYWRYGFKKIEFDSYMGGKIRNLDTSRRLVLPLKNFFLLLSSTDVIHSWTIPSIGVKMDAFPGRINNIIFTPLYSGVFFGQCSEICGVFHSFIPIRLEVKYASCINNL